MKKIIILILILLFINIPSKIFAVEISSDLLEEQSKIFGIKDFLNEAQKYSDENSDGINISELFNSAVKGKIDNRSILKSLLFFLKGQTTSIIKVLASILSIVLIHSLLKIVTDNLAENNVSKIIYYVEYILIISVIMNNFSDIINSVRITIKNMTNFINTLIPLLSALMIYTGSITTSSLLEPIIIFIITFIGNLISTLILPVVSIIVVLSIISKISDKIDITRITNFMKSSVTWILGILLTVFVGVVSLEGSLTSSVDGITAKTAKAAVSSLIPVVGKILGDSVDSILGCGLVLKNALGIIGVVVVIEICIVPVIKLTIFSIIYAVTSAIIEPLADNKIINLLKDMSGIFKLLLAIICSVSALLIIGITFTVKISNNGMMYR